MVIMIEPAEEQLYGLLLLAGPPPRLQSRFGFEYRIHVTNTVHEFKWPPAYKHYPDGTAAFRAVEGHAAISAFIMWVNNLA